MKKIFALFALLLCFVQFSQAGDKVTRDVNKLPVAAREMIGKHFPATFIPNTIAKYMQKNYGGHKIVKIERDRKGYELTLENGLEVDFDQFGGFLKLSD